MRSINVLWLLALASLIFNSCKKESNPPDDGDPEISVVSYFPMAIGNQWVYQIFDIDSTGNESTEPGMFDTTEVISDTSINGLKYFVLEEQSWFFKRTSRIFLRNSNGNLVNEKGDVLFSESNFTTSILFFEEKNSDGEIIFTIDGKMQKHPEQVVVPAGSFSDNLLLNSKVVISPKYGPGPKYKQRFHAKGVGMIIDEILFAATPIGAKLQKRLFKYNIIKA